jgi:SepF-like predicted cell division protein (DUF552 family)
MVHVENTHWNDAEHSPFLAPYAALLVVNDITGPDIDETEQRIIASILTRDVETHIAEAEVDFRPESGFIMIGAKVEGEDTASALDVLSHDLLEAIREAGHDPETIELVAAHIAYEPELLEAQKQAPEGTVLIDDLRFMRGPNDPIPLFTINDLGEQMSTTAPEVFYKARDQVVGLL